MRLLFVLPLVALAALVGCFTPQPSPGAPCSADGACPTGLTCTDDRCLLPGTASDARDDAPTDDAPLDAAMDALIDAPSTLPRVVQQVTGASAPVTSLTVIFSAAPTPGNLLVAVTGCTAGSITSITGAANNWQQIASSTIHPNVEVYIGTATGASEVTVALATCTTQMSLSLSEWVNMSPAPFEDSTVAAGTTSPASAGALTIGAPRLVLFSAASFRPNTFGVPSDGPWSELTPIAPNAGTVEVRTWYRVSTSPATLSPTVTETRHEWDATLVSLKGI